jgi:transcriptional regulator with XRE-family HTH domain
MRFFGVYLKSLRVGKYSQRELAILLGVGFSYISKLESGVERFPNQKLLYKIV